LVFFAAMMEPNPPSSLYPVVEKFLTLNGLKKAAKALRKEAGLQVGDRTLIPDLMEIYKASQNSSPPEKKRKREVTVEDKDEEKQTDTNKRRKIQKGKKKGKKEKKEAKEGKKEKKQKEENERKEREEKERMEKENKEKQEQEQAVPESKKKKKKGKKAKTSKAQDTDIACVVEEQSKGSEKKEEESKALESNEVVAANGNAHKSTPRPFKRVREEEIYVDPRLQDNSYGALKSRGGVWGDKANAVLGAVRGKGFRHEKTKKKRGSYRGGQIDSNRVASIKFDDN